MDGAERGEANAPSNPEFLPPVPPRRTHALGTAESRDCILPTSHAHYHVLFSAAKNKAAGARHPRGSTTWFLNRGLDRGTQF